MDITTETPLTASASLTASMLFGLLRGWIVVTKGAAQPAHGIFDGNMAVAVEVEPAHVHAGIGLMARHGGNAVIEDNQGHVVIVEYGVDQAGNAAVEKCRIAYERNDFFVGRF